MENHHDTQDLVNLSFFVDIGKVIVSAKTIREILDRMMAQVGTIFAPRNWSLLLVDPKTTELVFKVAVGEVSDKLQGLRISSDEGITGWIYNTGQAVVIEDVTKDSRFSDRIDKLTDFTTQSIIGVPLKSGEKVLGIIELINKLNGEPFTSFDLKILSTIADFTAIAIEKAFYVRAIERLSRQDHLTNVLNRRSFDYIMQHESERCRRHGGSLSILLIDINSFKNVNDNYGHVVGDEVLKVTARLIKENIRKIDYVARYGGDEFAVVMPNTGSEAAEQVKKRILSAVEKFRHKELPQFSVSVGLQTAGSDGIVDILHKTDRELYREKGRQEKIRVEDHLLDFLNDEERENREET